MFSILSQFLLVETTGPVELYTPSAKSQITLKNFLLERHPFCHLFRQQIYKSVQKHLIHNNHLALFLGHPVIASQRVGKTNET